LINAIKTIVKKESGNMKKANEMEQNIFKIGVKCYILISSKKITLGELLAADKTLRQALEVFSKCYHHVVDYATEPGKIREDLLKVKLQQVDDLVKQAGKTLCDILKVHLQEKSIVRVHDIVNYLSNSETLLKVLKDTTLHEDLGELVMAGEHYSQFHFYAEDTVDLPPL